jgi:hypothetical protein
MIPNLTGKMQRDICRFPNLESAPGAKLLLRAHIVTAPCMDTTVDDLNHAERVGMTDKWKWFLTTLENSMYKT